MMNHHNARFRAPHSDESLHDYISDGFTLILKLQLLTLERLTAMAVTDTEALAVLNKLKHGWGEVSGLVTDLRDQIATLVADESNGVTAETLAGLSDLADQIEAAVPDEATVLPTTSEPAPTEPAPVDDGTVAQPDPSPADEPQTPEVPDPTPLAPPLENPAPTDAAPSDAVSDPGVVAAEGEAVV